MAWATEQLKVNFTVGNFPPTIDLDSIIAAVVGAVILSVVSLAIGLLPFMKTSR